MILPMLVTMIEVNIVQSWIQDSTPQRSISGKSLAWINSSTVLVNINLAYLSPIKLFEVIASDLHLCAQFLLMALEGLNWRLNIQWVWRCGHDSVTMNFVGISQTRTVRNRMQIPMMMMMMISKKMMYH